MDGNEGMMRTKIRELVMRGKYVDPSGF